MWDCLNLDTGQLWVRRQYKRTRDGLAFVNKPKTQGSKRSMVLPAFVVRELKKVKAEQEKNKSIFGSEYKDFNLVCCWPDGSPLDPDWISCNFKKFIKSLGLKVRLHDTRHSHVTLLTEMRISDKEVQDRVGHVTMVMKNRYTHVTSAMNDHVANMLDQEIFQHIEEMAEQQKNQDPASFKHDV